MPPVVPLQAHVCRCVAVAYHDPRLLLLVGESQLFELLLILELVQKTLMNIHEGAGEICIRCRRQLLQCSVHVRTYST